MDIERYIGMLMVSLFIIPQTIKKKNNSSRIDTSIGVNYKMEYSTELQNKEPLLGIIIACNLANIILSDNCQDKNVYDVYIYRHFKIKKKSLMLEDKIFYLRRNMGCWEKLEVAFGGADCIQCSPLIWELVTSMATW